MDLATIEKARRSIREHIVHTPCTPSEAFGDLFGGTAWFKFENLQRTGSFKDRGALARILEIPESERRAGVVAASAGNHAQGVAYHAGRLGLPATIVMPQRTPLIKVSNTEGFGAKVLLHGSNYDESMEEARRIESQHGATLIHPFDDPAIIAGQGTIGLELLDQCPTMDVVLVPIGGGGLISGLSVAIKSHRPDVRIIGVETARLPSAWSAVQAGELVTIPPADTIADGIAVRRVGEHTLPLIQEWVDEIVTVSEEDIASAVLLLLEREKTVAEPAAAATLAAILANKVAGIEDQDVVMILSGGNIDVNLLSRIIDRGLVNDGRLTSLEVRVEDRPGALASLTATIAQQGGNILRLDHRRGTEGLWLTEAIVEMLLETRGRSHVNDVVGALEEAGYTVKLG